MSITETWRDRAERALIDELERTRAELGSMKLAAIEMHASFNEARDRAERAEAERDRLMKLISVRETDWEANKAAVARVEAYCEDSSLWRDITVAGVLAALRGEQ